MNVTGAYRLHGPHSLQGPHAPRSTQPASPNLSLRGADQVDISAAADAAAQAADGGDFRSDLVARVRQQIADGTYETPIKLDVAIDRFLDEQA
ncbi:MAG TPA: flagellar biosynthesis anti-sigma factor FlgM [Lacipirellulaceae bacterium]|nr:flagellar biosynthesis anti-sigma factor FlgM [Lacipirellulaceae bacterium]HMP04757.1 flagellar biosynthesis anti-sigma factor FlgM [Lacipirellulaceae bacterium]